MIRISQSYKTTQEQDCKSISNCPKRKRYNSLWADRNIYIQTFLKFVVVLNTFTEKQINISNESGMNES